MRGCGSLEGGTPTESGIVVARVCVSTTPSGVWEARAWVSGGGACTLLGPERTGLPPSLVLVLGLFPGRGVVGVGRQFLWWVLAGGHTGSVPPSGVVGCLVSETSWVLVVV